MNPEQQIINILKKNNIEYTATLPCVKVKNLISLFPKNFTHIPLIREEEGIGICTGLYLAGTRSIMLIQSSGTGNSINAIISLAKYYDIPLPILISHRGVYNERISAQIPMGIYLPKIFKALDLPYLTINEAEEIDYLDIAIKKAYEKETPYAIMLSPKIWEKSNLIPPETIYPNRENFTSLNYKNNIKNPTMTRYDALTTLKPFLKNKAVICNIGVPSRELYQIFDQPSNFYMLGSFGLASSIGLGVSLPNKKEVVVIDGDGSILTNPNALCSAAQMNPNNLTIIVIDNGTHGSTGNQITYAYNDVDLELLAKSFGFKNTVKVHSEIELRTAIQNLDKGLNFIHIIVKPKNLVFDVIPISAKKIKERFMESMKF